MIGLKKKQPFLLKNKLTIDFALPLKGKQLTNIGECMLALQSLGIHQVVFSADPIAATTESNLNDMQTDSFMLPIIEGVAIEVVPSYWLDETLEIFVKEHSLRTYRDKYVLLAMRDLNSVRGLKGPLFEIRARGYEPIILHREPRKFAKLKLTAFEYLSDLGCLFQLDLLTLTGAYGQHAKAQGEALLSAELVQSVTTGISNIVEADRLATVHLSSSVISALEQTIKHHSIWVTEY